MKRCPTCGETWDDENLICPADSALLEPVAAPDAPGEAAPPPDGAVRRSADVARGPLSTGDLVGDALLALEEHRSHERDALAERMRQIEKYNTYSHAVWRFVHELTSQNSIFGSTLEKTSDDVRMRTTFVLSIGEGRNLRSFPIRVTYNRALGFDVTLEIDLEQIGPTREDQISRTESIGGRARSTRFGWSFTVLCPREIDGEDGAVQWLRQTFRTIFRLAYAPR
jgi:hypothetical protein